MGRNMVCKQGYTEYTQELLLRERRMAYILQGTTLEEGSNLEGKMYKGYKQEDRMEGSCRTEGRLPEMSSMLDIDLGNRETGERR